MVKSKKNTDFISVLPSRVMERIRAQKIVMHPSSYFAVRRFAIGTLLAFFVVFGSFFASVMLFKVITIQYFGPRFVFSHFPWFSAGLTISSILIIFALLEYYRVFYKISLVMLFVGVVAFLFSAGFVIYKSPLSTRLSKGRLEALYSVEEQPLEVYAGRVLEVRTQSGFVLETLRGDKIRVYIPVQTAKTSKGIEIDDSLLVAGYYKGGVFVTQGIILLGRK